MDLETNAAAPQDESMDVESIQKERWYFGKIGRLVAEQCLAHHLSVGTFLIRDSDSTPDMYSMSVVKGTASEGYKISHHKIMCVKNKSYWIHPSRIFSNLQALVAFYKRNSTDIGVQITVPCPKEDEASDYDNETTQSAERKEGDVVKDGSGDEIEVQMDSDSEETENRREAGSPTFYIVKPEEQPEPGPATFPPIKEPVAPKSECVTLEVTNNKRNTDYVNIMKLPDASSVPSPTRAKPAPSQEEVASASLEVPTKSQFQIEDENAESYVEAAEAGPDSGAESATAATAAAAPAPTQEPTPAPTQPKPPVSPRPVARSKPIAETSSQTQECSLPPEADAEPPEQRYTSEVANKPWYFGSIGREKAVQLLSACGVHGMYLVRDSESSAGRFTLTAYHGDKSDYRVANYRIEMEGSFCHLGTSSLQFASISGLLTYYRNHQLSPKFKLTLACPKDGPRQKVEATKELDQATIALDKQVFFGTQHEHWQGIWEGVMDVSVIIVRKTNKVLGKGWRTHVEMINNLQHRNIASFYGTAKYDGRDQIYVVTEWMEKGSLLNCLQQPLFPNFLEKISVAEQIANALLYLQARKVVLRNLQANNIGVTKDSECKLVNFQTAEFLNNGLYQEEGEIKDVPTKWTAPEAAVYGKFTTASDVWSYGVLLYEIFSDGRAPYADMSPLESLLRIKEGYRLPQPAQGDCPAHAYELMTQCWQEQPEERPTVADLRERLKHFYTITKVELVVLKHTFALMP